MSYTIAQIAAKIEEIAANSNAKTFENDIPAVVAFASEIYGAPLTFIAERVNRERVEIDVLKADGKPLVFGTFKNTCEFLRRTLDAAGLDRAALESYREEVEAEAKRQAQRELRARREAEYAAMDAAHEAHVQAVEAEEVAAANATADAAAKLATATEFKTIEGKEVAGVGGSVPTAVAIDDATGAQISLRGLVKIETERQSGRVMIHRITVPVVDGVSIRVNYWWNKPRTATVRAEG
jgi:hypothetical protein